MKDEFKSLKIWQNAFEITKDIYELTQSFPKEEIYSMTSQIRRSISQFHPILRREVLIHLMHSSARFLEIALGIS
jgi:hypothetical protein